MDDDVPEEDDSMPHDERRIGAAVGKLSGVGGILIHPHILPKHGMLGTTFGGNHLACAAALAVLAWMAAIMAPQISSTRIRLTYLGGSNLLISPSSSSLLVVKGIPAATFVIVESNRLRPGP